MSGLNSAGRDFMDNEWTHIRIRIATKREIDRRKPKSVSYDDYVSMLSRPANPTPRRISKGVTISIWPLYWFNAVPTKKRYARPERERPLASCN